MRRDLLADKLQTAVTAWVTVPDARGRRGVPAPQREGEARGRSAFQADAYRTGLTATRRRGRGAPSTKNKEKYRIGERRKIRYLIVDTQALRAKITRRRRTSSAPTTPTSSSTRTPSRCSVAHILLKTEGKDEADGAQAGRGVLAEVKARRRLRRAGHEVLGRRGQQGKGGDLDFFGARRDGQAVRGRGLRAGAGPDQRSREDRLRVPHHQVCSRSAPPGVRPLAEVRDQLVEQVKSERAQEQASTLVHAARRRRSPSPPTSTRRRRSTASR